MTVIVPLLATVILAVLHWRVGSPLVTLLFGPWAVLMQLGAAAVHWFAARAGPSQDWTETLATTQSVQYGIVAFGAISYLLRVLLQHRRQRLSRDLAVQEAIALREAVAAHDARQMSPVALDDTAFVLGIEGRNGCWHGQQPA